MGWKCPSCLVNYAPSITECRCSAVASPVHVPFMYPQPYTVPVYPWVGPYPWSYPTDQFTYTSSDRIEVGGESLPVITFSEGRAQA